MARRPASWTSGTEQARRTCKTTTVCPEQFILVRAARGAPGCSRNEGRDHDKSGRHPGAAAAGPGTTRQPGTTGAGPLRGPAVRCRQNRSIGARARQRGAPAGQRGTLPRYGLARARHPRRTSPRTARPDTRGPPPGACGVPGIYAPNPPRPAHPDMSPLVGDQRAARRSEPGRITPQPSHSGGRQEPAPPRPPPNQPHSGSSQGPRPAAHLDKTCPGWPEHNDPDQLTPPAPDPAGQGKNGPVCGSSGPVTGLAWVVRALA